MSRPTIVAVDDDPTALATVVAELTKRYGEDYEILAHASAEAALRELRHLRDDGRPVALLLADEFVRQTLKPRAAAGSA